MGSRLRHLRSKRGVSLSELSRRSGVGKGTISELENDRRGARLDTLFALATALDAPLGALLPEGASVDNEHVVGASVTATLLDRWTVDSDLVEVYRATLTPDRQLSHAHAEGIEETVTVVHGGILAGPAGDEQELGEGESLRYPGDVPHVFQAITNSADVVLLMHYPDHARKARQHDQ